MPLLPAIALETGSMNLVYTVGIGGCDSRIWFHIHYSFDLSGLAHEEGGGRVFIVSTNALD